MHKIYAILLVVMLACIGCEWRLRNELKTPDADTFIERYDKIETSFLTTGDFSVMQQMQTQYPLQTRRLIENVLQLGKVEDANIKTRFYNYFQDSTLQTLIKDVDLQYADMEDLDGELFEAFEHLKEMVPAADVPAVYTQITSLDQSICVGDGVLGISLDKYLGTDYPLYIKFGYTDRQRATMSREFIVPDCLSFYLLSLYPSKENVTWEQRTAHMGSIQHVVNSVLDYEVFSNEHVEKARQRMIDEQLSFPQLLQVTSLND